MVLSHSTGEKRNQCQGPEYCQRSLRWSFLWAQRARTLLCVISLLFARLTQRANSSLSGSKPHLCLPPTLILIHLWRKGLWIPQGEGQDIVIVTIAFQGTQQKKKSWLDLRTISCYDEPEIQDSTENWTVDRIWLNWNLQREIRGPNKVNGEAQDWSGMNVRTIAFQHGYLLTRKRYLPSFCPSLWSICQTKLQFPLYCRYKTTQ